MPIGQAPKQKKAGSSSSQTLQPVASGSGSGSGSAPRKSKPKLVKSKDPGFDFECEGVEEEEDLIQNKYRLGEENNSGMNNLFILVK